MFVEACEMTSRFTRPVVSSVARVDGTVQSSMGTYFMINRDGWALTCAHIIDATRQQRDDQNKMRAVDHRNSEEPGRDEKYDPSWIKAQSFWWGNDRIGVQTAHLIGDLDIALVKLINIPDDFITEYPVFADPSTVKMGESVCRIGFPFVSISSTFDESTRGFRLEGIGQGMLPFFPNDAIITRLQNVQLKDAQGVAIPPNPLGIQNLQIETSTPGLRGQSGGPIFDVHGNIVGMQSVTRHIPLGFGDRNIDGKYMPEQFLNVGCGPFVTTLLKAMDHFGVKYKTTSDDDGFRIIG